MCSAVSFAVVQLLQVRRSSVLTDISINSPRRMRNNSELNFFKTAVTNSLDSTAASVPQNDDVMVSSRGSVRLSGIGSICACVAELISTYDLVGHHVARHLCGFAAGDVHSDRNNTVFLLD